MTDEPSRKSPPAPAATCPKCGKKRAPGAESCPRCGLVFSLWKADDAAGTTTLDARGAELWEDAKKSWDDMSKHEALLKHCLQSGTLPAAGRLYRDRLDEVPNDAVALHMQAQVLAKATLSLSIHKSQPVESITRNRWFWLVVLTAMALGIAGGLFWQRLR